MASTAASIGAMSGRLRRKHDILRALDESEATRDINEIEEAVLALDRERACEDRHATSFVR
jgi:hypothetical protein